MIYPASPAPLSPAQGSLPKITTDQQGFVLRINAAFTAVFGWDQAELLGQPITVIIPSTFHDAHHLGFSRFVTTGQSHILNHPLQLKAITKQGQEILSEHLIRAERVEDRWQFTAILRPLESVDDRSPPSSDPDRQLSLEYS